jgi:hypothetical protein
VAKTWEQRLSSQSASAIGSWRPALVLVLVVTVLRLVYLRWFCPYALAEDEAYYWMWSRHLDWSYLTKGPGIALSIALGTLVGGDTEFGVRLTAPLWGGVLALGVAGLSGELAGASNGWHACGSAQAREKHGGSDHHDMAVQSHSHAARHRHATPIRRARLCGAAIALLSPPMQAAALFMTIDGPMLACWAVAVWMGVRAVRAPASAAAWPGAGLAIGVGVLFKPAIAVLVPVLALSLLARRARTTGGVAVTLHNPAGTPADPEACLSKAKGTPLPVIALGSLLAVAGFIPIIAWNALHAWPMVAHLGDHLSSAESPGLARRLAWIGEYVALQAILGGVALAAAIVGATASARHTPRSIDRHAAAVCVACSAAVYALYLAVACFTRVEGNWPLGGLIPLLGIAGACLAAARCRAAPRHLARAAAIIGLITGLGMLRLDLLARLPGVGPLAPIDRLTAGPTLASGVTDLLARHAALADHQAMVVTDHYGRAALLEFYLNGRANQTPRTPVFITCASHALGGPRTQFDLWATHRLDNPALLGRPALLLGGRAQRWAPLFGGVEPLEPITADHKRRGVFVGRAYRGLPPAAAGAAERDR